MEEEQNIPNCQNGDNDTLPAGTLKISPEQNIESISPLIQHKRDTEVPEGWKLGNRMLRMSYKPLAIVCSEYILILHEK